MAVFVQSQMRVLVDELDIAGFANRAELTATVDELDVSTLNCNGWRQKIPGLATTELAVEGFQDFATGSVDAVFQGTGTGLDVFSICPTGFGDTVADACFIGQGRTTTRSSLQGEVGDAAGFALTWTGDGRAVRSQVLHPLAARTTTGNGTATTFTTPITGQSLWAAVHVTAVSGTTPSLTVNVQTDDNAGMSSATTRVSSSAFTGVGAQFLTVAGPFAGETHIRITYTISGTTPSFTFFVAVGTN